MFGGVSPEEDLNDVAVWLSENGVVTEAIARTLCEAGANRNRKDRRKLTALQLAEEDKKAAVVKYLTELGRA